MHVTVCLNGAGHHPGAWRLSGGAFELDLARLKALSAMAETGGFAAAFFGFSISDLTMPLTGRFPAARPDALTLVAALIAHTDGIGLGATYGLDRSEPYTIARSLATLDLLSLGRTAWIVELAQQPGARTPGTASSKAENGEDYDRESECIDVVKKLWDSWEDGAFTVDKAKGQVADASRVHRIDHAGRYFSVRGPLNVPRPTQGQPVLVMSDPGTTKGRKLAAEMADVLVLYCSNGDEACALRQTVRSFAASAGRNPDALRVLMNVFPVLGTTNADAQRTYSMLNDAIGADMASAWAQSRVGVPFVGTPEQLAGRLAELYASQACDGFNIMPATLPDDLRLIVDHTLPLLRQKDLFPESSGRTLRARLGLAHPRSRYAESGATSR